MILLPGGIQSISIFDDNSSPSVAVTTTGVRDFSYNVAENYFETASGKRRVVSRVHTASMVIVDLGIIEQLKTWEADETPVQFVALGLSRHVQGYQDSYLNITPLVSVFGSNTAYRIDIVNEQFAPEWYSNANLVWYAGWEDTVATGIPDNWGTLNANMIVTPTFASDELTLTVDGDTIIGTPNNGRIFIDVPLPFPGAQVTMSSEITQVITGKTSIAMTAINASGSGLGLVSQSAPSAARFSVTTTLPATTYGIRLFPLQIFNATESGAASCKFPSLFVGSSAPEAKY